MRRVCRRPSRRAVLRCWADAPWLRPPRIYIFATSLNNGVILSDFRPGEFLPLLFPLSAFQYSPWHLFFLLFFISVFVSFVTCYRWRYYYTSSPSSLTEGVTLSDICPGRFFSLTLSFLFSVFFSCLDMIMYEDIFTFYLCYGPKGVILSHIPPRSFLLPNLSFLCLVSLSFFHYYIWRYFYTHFSFVTIRLGKLLFSLYFCIFLSPFPLSDVIFCKDVFVFICLSRD